MHRPSGRWPGSARLWSVWSSRVINLQELIIQTRPVSVHPGNWGRGSWQGPWFWVCTAAPERLREPNCWRQVHKTGGKKKRTSLSCFLQFPYKVSQSQLTIQLILIASRVPAPSPCFFVFFMSVCHMSTELDQWNILIMGTKKKNTLLLFLFSLFGGSASSRPPAGGNHFPPPEHSFCHTGTRSASVKAAAGSQAETANRHIFTNDGGTSDITLSPLISFLDFPNESAPHSACAGSKCQLFFFFLLCPLPYHLMSHFHVQTSVFGVGVFFFFFFFESGR